MVLLLAANSAIIKTRLVVQKIVFLILDTVAKDLHQFAQLLSKYFIKGIFKLLDGFPYHFTLYKMKL